MAQEPQDPHEGPDSDEDLGVADREAPAAQPGSSQAQPPSATGPLRKVAKLLWRFFSGSDEVPEPKSSKCVIMGPSASGKTLLLMSLDRCADARSHSYGERYLVAIGDKNRDFKTIEGWLDHYFESGLQLDASDLGTCFLPEFTLYIKSEQGGMSRFRSARFRNTRFRTFDGVGGLLVENFARTDPGYLRCREALMTALEDCDTVLLCLPILLRVRDDQEKALKEFLLLFLREQRIRTLVVCFTMYESLALQSEAMLERAAYRTLATRSAAREQMAAALSDRLSALDNVLRQFHDKHGRRKVWCVPVSTYGFVPGNGGANLARIVRQDGGGVIEDSILRTRPAARDDPAAIPDPERPYAYETAMKEYWQPFLTLDPFVFIATGDRSGTLIHSYDELWD